VAISLAHVKVLQSIQYLEKFVTLHSCLLNETIQLSIAEEIISIDEPTSFIVRGSVINLGL
jgi:hypothetical protein